MIQASSKDPFADRAVEDLYPSRINENPALLPRHDPVVYGQASDGPLSAQQLDDFQQNGFLILPKMLNEAQVQACLAELDRLRKNREWLHRPEAIVEPKGAELRSLFAPHRPEISPLFARVAADQQLAGVAQQILDSEIHIHQSRVNLKPGFAGKEFYWHSDFETWHVEDGMPRMRAVSCSILLTDNFEFNGPLMLVPGSHRRYIACVGQTPEDHYKQSLRRQQFGVPDNASLTKMIEEGGIVTATGTMGTVVFFDCNTLHGSNGNITPFPRSNLFFVYNSIHNHIVEPFCGHSPRPEFVASRQRCPVLQPCSVLEELAG